jgi:hypothetical protein
MARASKTTTSTTINKYHFLFYILVTNSNPEQDRQIKPGFQYSGKTYTGSQPSLPYIGKKAIQLGDRGTAGEGYSAPCGPSPTVPPYPRWPGGPCPTVPTVALPGPGHQGSRAGLTQPCLTESYQAWGQGGVRSAVL